ncbi:hypothetical protein, partial [Rhodococcoides fascians]|uniref:hypothetical protein n=1 Tax=Rhodococcoides fascians TaxID=1828 RepID=UPI001E3609F0
PGFTEKDRSSTAFTAPYCFVNPVTSIMNGNTALFRFVPHRSEVFFRVVLTDDGKRNFVRVFPEMQRTSEGIPSEVLCGLYYFTLTRPGG